MNNFLQTDLLDNEIPTMVVDDRGYAHCVWKIKDASYSKFNGTNWEFLNDKRIIPIPIKARLPKNCLALNSSNYPYIIYAIAKSTENPWGNTGYLHLIRWDGREWKIEQNYVLDSVLFGASLCFYNEDLYISALIKHGSSFLLSMIILQNGYFNQVGSIQISSLGKESCVLLKKVDNSLYCFWDNYDSINKWIEHVIFYPETKTFEYHDNKKINFTNDDATITGFDFAELI